MSDFYLISNKTGKYSSGIEVFTKCDTFSFIVEYVDKTTHEKREYKFKGVLVSIDIDSDKWRSPCYLNFNKFSIQVGINAIYSPVLPYIYSHYDRQNVACDFELNMGTLATPLLIDGVEYLPNELEIIYSHNENNHENETGVTHTVMETPGDLHCCYNCRYASRDNMDSQTMICELLKSILSIQHNIYRSPTNQFYNLEKIPSLSRDFRTTSYGSRDLKDDCYVDYLNRCVNFIHK